MSMKPFWDVKELEIFDLVVLFVLLVIRETLLFSERFDWIKLGYPYMSLPE